MHQKKMNLFLRVLFIILIIAISGAAILQIFAPEYMGRNSAYGISTGWQREIGFWNIAVLVILITAYRNYNWTYLKSISAESVSEAIILSIILRCIKW